MADERPYQANAAASVRPPKAPAASAAKALPPLSEAEHTRIKMTIAFVKREIPELVPMVKDLHDAGLIDGWRAVTIPKATA